ncbi:MAG: xanthine permease [Phycisphaerales bacterium]|nr:xanthine permease [Phycisphaerales bacterium]
MTDPARPGVIYGLDDKPPFGRAVLLAIQHTLTMFGATVSIPLLFGPAIWESGPPAAGDQQVFIAGLISAVMLCSGIATFLQSTFGTRLPIIQGVSFSFIAAFFFIINQRAEVAGNTHLMTLQYIAGAVILGAAVEMVVGFSGLMGWLRRVLSPVVIGPVIMLIGLALFQHGAPKAGTHWPVAGLTIFLVILFSLVLARRGRLFRLFPILLAIVVVVTLCWILTVTGVFPGDDPATPDFDAHPAYVNLSAVHAASWVRVNPVDVVFPWGMPRFNLAFFVAVLAGYLASMVESFGDYHACSHMAGGGDPTPKQISRGIGFEGLGCALTGVFGGFSSTSYSENIGVVGITRVGSRYVVQIAAVILILLGLFGKFGAISAAIPGPVVGGLYCALFGLIAAVGVQQLAKADLHSDRNLFIAGFSLFMGLSVPAWFLSVDAPAQAGQIKATYYPTVEGWLTWIGTHWSPGAEGIIEAIGKNGMAVAAIIGLLLDNLIPGTHAERGIHPPSTIAIGAGDETEVIEGA